jgi:plastocyanin
MSHDEHGHEKEPIILTSGRRMGKGLAIIIITLAIGAGIAVPFFDEMFRNPPPVSQIRTERPPPTGGEPPAAGTTTIAIPQGAATQGNPDYDPDEAQIPLGNKIVWDNQDSVPHTATSGTGPSDPASADIFDTGVILNGEKSKAIEITGVNEGDSIDYYCILHPYMTSKLTITAAGESGQTGGSGGAAAGPMINILEGAATQGSPDYDPKELTAKVGDEITVVNQDMVPHTVTSGTGPSDPNNGQLFDTNIMTAGQTAKISLAEVDPGQYDYYCIVHPYMTGKIIVE